MTFKYPEGHGDFYFKDGQLVDATVGNSHGAEAVVVALAISGATFDFDPSLRPMRQTINLSWESLMTDALRQLDEGALPGELFLQDDEFESQWSRLTEASPQAPRKEKVVYRAGGALSRPVALGGWRLPALAGGRRGLSVGLALTLFIALATVSIVAFNKQFKPAAPAVVAAAAVAAAPEKIAVAEEAPAPVAESAEAPSEPVEEVATAQGTEHAKTGLRPRTKSVPAARPGTAAAAAPMSVTDAPAQAAAPVAIPANLPAPINDVSAPPPDSHPGPQTIMVSVQVQDGGVAKAFVPYRRPEAEAFEAAALRLARQRRFPNTGNGAWETLLIKVDSPER